MTSTALTLSQVMGNAAEKIEVGDEELSINKVYVRLALILNYHLCHDGIQDVAK